MTFMPRRLITALAVQIGICGACMGLMNTLAADEKPANPSPNQVEDPKGDNALKKQNDNSPTLALLKKLKVQNAGQELFQDPWCQTLKDIVDLGSDAVPELIAELDSIRDSQARSDDLMIRCLGFTLRAIGDKRAVPALIRAIPKTLRPPGSDMGLAAKDPKLMKFAQENDLDPGDRATHYSFGRPVREVCGAIQKLTGKKLTEEETFHVFQGGSPSQAQRKRVLFQRTAEKWAEFWEQNWANFVQDANYSKVNLPTNEEDELLAPPSPDSHFKTEGGSSGWILESMKNPKATHVFYDLDVGRVASLSEKWRDVNNIESRLDEILFWARREGFDLMGTEHETPEGRKIFVLRAIGMQVWELGKDRWKMTTNDITLKELQAEGRPSEKLLVHYDDPSESIKPLESATFLFTTAHGTPGLLFVGIEVQDDSLKPGGILQGDNELSPVAFSKGRRFGYTCLEEIKR